VVVGMGGYFGTSVALKLGGRGDVTQTHRLWTKERTKNRLGSAVIHEGHIYTLNSDGIAECLELQTGRKVWEERLPKKGPKGESWSCLVRAGELLYVLNQSGDTVVYKASPKFEVVSVNPLDGVLTNASLAVSDGEVFIRTHTHLWCIGSVATQAVNLPSPPKLIRLTLQP
jgi:outer membrane protein assembly factor BamB